MKTPANPWIRGALSVAGLVLLLFCCFMSFVAHGWANDNHGVWLTLLIALAGPLLTWKACRGSLISGAGIFVAVLIIVWIPPWVIAPLPAMLLITVVALFGVVGLLCLRGPKNETSS